MKGVIWYWVNQSSAIDELRAMAQRYKKQGIDVVTFITSKYQPHVIFANGDIWKVLAARDSSRGQKCNISYISRRIPQEWIHNIVEPNTMEMPFRGFCYWD